MAENSDYSDIIDLPHHVSSRHPQMPLANRAAQFAPFSALTGYDECLAETGRVTWERPELDENAKNELDEKIQFLLGEIGMRRHPRLQVQYFVKDERKSGGKVCAVTGELLRLNQAQRSLLLAPDVLLKIEDILDINIIPG